MCCFALQEAHFPALDAWEAQSCAKDLEWQVTAWVSAHCGAEAEIGSVGGSDGDIGRGLSPPLHRVHGPVSTWVVPGSGGEVGHDGTIAGLENCRVAVAAAFVRVPQ